jgi:serine/threonine-protein phosphatase 6 regulatory ankyrin repeat subunit B
MILARRGESKSVEELLKRGANPDLQNIYGNTALILAAYNNRVEIVRELLNYGADPYLQDEDGLTAYDVAQVNEEEDNEEENEEVINLLLTVQVDPNLTDRRTGVTNLMILAANGPRMVFDAAIPRINNIDQQDLEGNTALIHAILNFQKDHVKLLLENGADKNLANNGGAQPIDYAQMKRDHDIINLIRHA